MKLRASLPCHLVGLCMIRCASWLVPREQRRAWLMEWNAELWHVRELCTPQKGVSLEAERQVAEFCWGAFQDARCLRQADGKGIARVAVMGSAMRCVFSMLVLLAASYGAALLLPGAFVAMHPPQYKDVGHLVLIQSTMAASDTSATISGEQYNTWKARPRKLFDGFAFYQVMQRVVFDAQGPGARGKAVKESVAIASPDLFRLLGVNPDDDEAAQSGDGVLPMLLSSSLWHRRFGGDPAILGREISINSASGAERVRVAGVVPEGFWRLPGKVDAWILTPDSAIPANAVGYVVGRVSSAERYPRWTNSWEMTAPLPNGNTGEFLCVHLSDRMRGPQGLFLFAVILACLALPATTSLPLGEYRGAPHGLSWGTRLRRWTFLSWKLGLLLPIVYFASLDLAHLTTSIDPIKSEYIQLLAAFSLCLFGLRWVLRDQRERCPVCLRTLTNPARVGHPSRNFLAWNGTELICTGGHGLLHVPDIETSWFSTQRWLYLDSSWEILFAESASASYF